MTFRTEDFPVWAKGTFFEQFEAGQTFDHHWGRTLGAHDAALFNALTLGYHPLFVNDEYARSLGHERSPINSYLVFLTVLGLSVEDTSEKFGGAFLGVERVQFLAAVYPGDTITAHTEVVATRESRSRPDTGIVTWRTHGRNQRDDVVLELTRMNLVARKDRA